MAQTLPHPALTGEDPATRYARAIGTIQAIVYSRSLQTRAERLEAIEGALARNGFAVCQRCWRETRDCADPAGHARAGARS